LGHEFGATTGRPRRTGWLDLPTLKYAIMLNGVTDLICTKSDVLSGFEEVLVCDGYDMNGKTTSEIPFDLSRKDILPLYRSFAGWTEDLTKIRNYQDLPATFKTYMDYVEAQIGVPVNVISVGPDREETIMK
jgi:adenylosuccinate synthase